MSASRTDTTITPDNYTLDGRYLATGGEVYLTGIQALARIPIEQLRLDRLAGRRTAAFVSGYPGSPLGGFDQELARALRTVGDDLPIEHLPAVNEELGASAVMGSQLAATRPDCRYEGVVGIWYGKAPGLDRATDAIRHGVFAGSSSAGGALALVGDDPSAKSSTMPSSSDAALVDLHMPILYPATTAECLELGLHGIAMSRATGLWSAMKVVTAVADGSGTVRLPVLDADPVLPRTEIDGADWQRTPSAQFLGPRMVEVEREFHEVRTGLALRYGRLNGLNRIEADPVDPWLGVVATGFTYGEVLEAFRRVGLSGTEAIEAAGIRLLNLRMPIPFDQELVGRFADGLEKILVVEEKNPTLETLVRSALYDTRYRPAVHGKTDVPPGQGLPWHGRVDADAILPVLRSRLADRLGDRLAPPPAPVRERIPLAVNRTPFFCSGCPHNWGTKVPDGAVVGMGTGCHGMTLLMDEERVGDSIGITAMGNEGAQWLGMAPFVDTEHVFQNFGDGTYFHSGQLAIQAAIGAGANVTFKILYNHTVAMTGGQDASHQVGPAALATILLAQGVERVVVTTDDLAGYDRRALPPGVDLRDRTAIVEVQDQLATIPGVTVLIHDQGCAAELRRGRRRGRIPTPTRRVVINHRICEGCGDCGDVSSCLSVQPVDTPLGRKTRIDQASCNYDESCLKGDCPAFMTVEVEPTASLTPTGSDLASLPVPDPPLGSGSGAAGDRARTVVRLAGIGGTGVVTVAQILGTAATLDGLTVAGLDQTGLSQKAGPVVSDLTLASPEEPRPTNAPGQGQADLILAFDLLVAAADGPRAGVGADTIVVASTAATPTGRQITDPTLGAPPADQLLARLVEGTGAEVALQVDANRAAEQLVGTAATANVLLLGAAVQTGRLPVRVESLRRAIEMNGVQVEANLAALAWGRRLVAHPETAVSALGDAASTASPLTAPPLPDRLAARVRALGLSTALDSLISVLAADLVDYQDRAYAGRFLDLVERTATHGDDRLTETVARHHHKLLAYKDEYEVARLLNHPDGNAEAEALGGERRWHLHPPTLKALGRGGKIAFGPRTGPMFAALARGKRLRGTRLDPFGRTEMRRMERALISEYESAIDRVLDRLTAASSGNDSNGSGRVSGDGNDHSDDQELMARAVRIAALPDLVRGFEDLKVRRVADYRRRLADELAAIG
ncbi:MAG: indolepyruvate ferredoxin oxidoreductase family protein [Actinomycetota bacterium]